MKNCLIVEDSKIVRMIAGRIIRELGFEVNEAEDGQLALQACVEKMPDCILLDWNMPNMNGIEFLQALRQVENGKKPRVIFCTIESDVHSIKHALENGANEYIIKPFDSDIIKTKFEQVGLL